MRILVLSPHTDDAELGAGGSILKFLESGDEIFWIVFSTAEESLPSNLPKDTLRREFLDVAASIGLANGRHRIFDFKVRYLHEHRQQILEELVGINKEFSPTLVIGPSMNDHHQDHEVVAREMIRAFKRASSIICYELPWNHIEFSAQLFVKLEHKHVERKLQSLERYRSQKMLEKPYFTKEFIFGWARMRGVQVGSEYAEAFEVIRWLM